MSVVIVTGSCGLAGSETVSFFANKGFDLVGFDSDMRKTFFGNDASVAWNKKRLLRKHRNYRHYDTDIRDGSKVAKLFGKYSRDTVLVVHTAAQPSHDWAACDPQTDFSINANGTLNLLEALRKHCPKAVFIFTSSNKVYGDRPNSLPFVELETRYELPGDHSNYLGIDEKMSIDACMHSLFGVSKAAADLLVQEYGRYFGIRTGIFRCGCLTGPLHSPAEGHGFLAYLVKCCLSGKKYTIFGYKGKQVRDNIHSFDLTRAFYHFFQAPRAGEVYNVGGSRFSNISVLEAIELCQKISGRKVDYDYIDKSRAGDHIWWISNISKFRSHYPAWDYKFGIEETVRGIFEAEKENRRSV